MTSKSIQIGLVFLLTCVLNVANGQLVSDFSSSTNGACAPSTIQFFEQTTGPVKDFLWTFGNGTTSIFPNPSVIYTQPGTYNVTLFVEDAAGNTSTVTKPIKIYKNPKVNFSSNQNVVCERNPIYLTNTSTQGDTTIASWLWDYGDGKVSTQKEPPHIYTTASVYSIKLEATDHFGCTGDTTITNYITVKNKPQTQFQFNPIRECTAPISVKVVNLTSPINTSFLWKFSDGSTSTQNSPTHSFSNFGKHDITLISTHASGCKDTLTIKDSIEVGSLSVDFTMPTSNGCSGETITFTENIQPKITSYTGFTWVFQDGTTQNGRTATKKLGAGNHSVRLVVNNKNCSGDTTKTIVNKSPPPNTIELSRKVICGNEIINNVDFDFDSTGVDSFVWRINNQYNRFAKSGSEIFNPEGEHYFQLSLRGTNGCKATYYDTIYHSIPSIEATQDTGACVPYTFTPRFNYSGKYPLDSVVWDLTQFGFGKVVGVNLPQLSVTDTGFYYIDYLVKDSLGCVFNFSSQIGGGFKPTAAYTNTNDTICNGGSLSFTNTSTSPNLPTSYYWNIGTASGNTKTWLPVIKDLPKDYTLTHIVSHYGCKDSIIDEDKIHLKGPYAYFNYTDDSCINSFKTINGVVDEADTFYYLLNDVFFRIDTTFKYSFTDKDRLKIIASNSTTMCSDSAERIIVVSDNASLNWQVFAGECTPASIEVHKTAKNIDSTKWYLNNIDMQHQRNILSTTLRTGGSVNVKLRGYAGDGCSITLDTTITVIGPRIKSLIGQSFGCFPKTYTLIDSFWNDNVGPRTWIVDGDSFPSESVSTQVTLKGLKDATNNIVVIKLIAGNDSCYATKQYNYANPGIRFSSGYADSIIDCDVSQYTFIISPNPDDAGNIDKFYLEYNGVSQSNFTGLFKKNLILDGSKDSVYLSIRSTDGCLTTQLVEFEKQKPVLEARFSSTMANATCPPLLVEFKDESTSKFGKIVSRVWKIEDQFFSIVKNPKRVFSLPGEYNISLVVEDERGCKDSISMDSFVSINGEKVDVDFGEDTLCSYDSIVCSIVSGNASKYEWDMGDGSVEEGNAIKYKYSSNGIYRLQLLVSDSNNCKYPIFNQDSTSIFKAPIAQFEVENQCINSKLFLKNNSLSSYPIVSKLWSVQSTNFSDVDSLEYTVTSGIVQSKLSISDINGCMDSISKNLKLYNLSADFILDKSYYCLGDSVKAINQSSSDTNVVEFTYHINGNLISQLENPSFNFQEGNFDVTLIVKNEANCYDSITKLNLLKIVGPNTNSNTKINYLSVGENNEVFFNLEKDTTGIFSNYSIYQGATEIWKSNNVNSLSGTLNDLTPEKNTVCLRAGVNTGCFAPNPAQLEEHCTINTYGQSGSMSRIIHWSPYVGWDKVDSYSVYRESTTGYILIGSVPGDSLSFVDYEHINCDEVQKYKVAAYGKDISYSDTCHVTPFWDYTIDAPVITNISVLDNEFIEIWIDTSGNTLIDIEKHGVKRIGSDGESSFEKGLNYFIDSSVNVQSGTYSYQVSQKDACNSESLLSNKVNSIFLDVQSDPVSLYPQLVWTKADIWDVGVKYYIVFKIVNDEINEVARVYDINDTTYIDKSGDIQCSTNACYIVMAYSKDNSKVSRSNVNCTGTFSRLFAPNTVTANGDNLNDNFQPVGMYINQYSLEIFNRWGEKIFATTTCLEPWNCTYKNQPVAEGTYFYIISATGADGVRHNLKGSLNLIR